MLKYPIPQSLIDYAAEEALTVTLNKSITNGDRNHMATLAELCYIKLLSHIHDMDDIIYEPSFDYDLTLAGIKIDVKSKQRTVAPREDYAASIVAYTKDKQMCDYYAFTNITVDPKGNFKDFYYMGHMKKVDYFSKAKFMRKGQKDGDNMVGGKQFTIRADCYNLEYGQLHQYDEDTIEEALQKGFELIKN